MGRVRVSLFVLALLSGLGFGQFLSPSAIAEPQRPAIPANPYATHPEFRPTPGLQASVDFWVSVFTRYGKEQIVFHHRQVPEVIYSVIDLRELAASMSSGEYEQRKRREDEAEKARIQALLLKLAGQGRPTNRQEEQLAAQFHRAGFSDLRRACREAAELENIRSQVGIRRGLWAA